MDDVISATKAIVVGFEAWFLPFVHEDVRTKPTMVWYNSHQLPRECLNSRSESQVSRTETSLCNNCKRGSSDIANNL